MFWYNHDFWRGSSLLWGSIIGILCIIILLFVRLKLHVQERKILSIYTVLISSQVFSILSFALLLAQGFDPLNHLRNLFYGINLLFALFIPLPIIIFTIYFSIQKRSLVIYILSILCFISTLLQFIPIFGYLIQGFA